MKSWIVDPAKCKHCGKFSYDADDAAYVVGKFPVPMQIYECHYAAGIYHLSSRK